MVQLVQADRATLDTVLSLVVFTAPGVLIGGHLASIVASRLSPTVLERSMGILFMLVGAILLGEIAVRHRQGAIALRHLGLSR